MMDYAVHIRDVSKHYKLYPSHISMALDFSGYYKAQFWKPPPMFPLKKALNCISVDIKKGDRVGIIGRNGAGKTTLLKIIGGMISPTSGKISVNGRIQSLMHLGASFHPDFSGAENIRHGLLYNGLRGKELDRAFDDVADFVELGDFLQQPVRSYSMGMATRLQFAVATAVKPEILIIDEVLGAGDAYFATKSADRMRTLTRSGCTLLLVSHARSQIMEFCTSALWLDQGCVRQYGDLAHVTEAYDRAIAEAIGASDNKNAQRGILPIPGHLTQPGYLNSVKQVVGAMQNGLVWEESVLPNAQIQVKNDKYPQHGGLKAINFEIGGQEANFGSTGDRFSVSADVSDIPECDLASVTGRLLFFAHGGAFVASMENTHLLRDEKGAFLVFALDQLPLGHRDYLLAVVIEANHSIVTVQAGVYFKVMETNESDPPYALLSGVWSYNGTILEKSRVDGWV